MGPAAVKPLTELFHDRNTELRIFAVTALALMAEDTPEVLPALELAAKDSDEGIRSIAATGIAVARQ